MATFRPKFGYSAWPVAPQPVKRVWDWPKITVWGGLFLLCLGFWVVVILGCAKAI